MTLLIAFLAAVVGSHAGLEPLDLGVAARSSSSVYRSFDVAIGGGGPANMTRSCFIFDVEPALLEPSLLPADVLDGLLRSKGSLDSVRSASGDKRASSARGDRSARSYSLLLLRSEDLEVLWKGRTGESPRENERRGRKDDLAVILTVRSAQCCL